MADKKISQLTSASTPLAGTEVLPLVQSGATLKVTAENIFTTTQPSGNANGIVYLNGSKQATTSASFFYNGTNLGINTSSVTAIFGKTIQLGDGTANNTIYMVGASGGSGFIANVGTIFSFTGRGSTTLSFGTNDVERITVDLNGNTTLLTGNLVMGTAGKGIDFSANTHAPGMTSELLNWYEEGTWTPVFNNLTVGNGSVSGAYIRVGRIVIATALLNFGSTSAWGGACASISGLPFTSAKRANGTISFFRTGYGPLMGQVTLAASQTATSFPTLFDGTALAATTPWTWGAGDEATITIIYEA